MVPSDPVAPATPVASPCPYPAASSPGALAHPNDPAADAVRNDPGAACASRIGNCSASVVKLFAGCTESRLHPQVGTLAHNSPAAQYVPGICAASRAVRKLSSTVSQLG